MKPGEAPWQQTAPPYNSYRGEPYDYEARQYNAVGSGRLGGWSQATQGGSFEAEPPEQPEAAPPPEPPRLSWDTYALAELRRER